MIHNPIYTKSIGFYGLGRNLPQRTKRKKKTKKAEIRQKILDDLKKKDYLEKKQELEVLKKRILELEKDLENYK